MQFLFQLYDDERRWAGMAPDVFAREMGAYMTYTDALREAGVYVDGNPLEPTSSAATIRVGADGTTTVLDGPYADTKEQLGGYYLIDVADLDAALSWAARCPCASHGAIEVRAIRPVIAAV